MLDEMIASSPDYVDLTNATHLELVKEKVNELIEIYGEIEEIDNLEEKLIARKDKSLIFPLLALKIAKSRLLIRQIDSPVTVSVVFAVYKEHNRIKKNSEHPHGEDFLRRKVSQLEWLSEGNPHFNWELIIVDDGCPESSGKIAEAIIKEHELSDKVSVLFLEDAIEKKLPVTHPLASTRESQKGGAIAYGMWHAAQKEVEGRHIVIFTDADLSTHLGQVGLLIDPILTQEKSAAIGSRRERNSVVIKKGTRNNRGKLFIYLWKRLIPNLADIIDTQCGFKAFDRDLVLEIVEDLMEKKFAFDIELLLKTALVREDAIAKVPVAWIDSEAASTTTDLQPYLPMLQSISKMYQKYLPSKESTAEFANFIQSLSEKEFQTLLEDIPSGISSREPLEFISFAEVSVTDLEKKIR
jgi:glycosyltransferase involved in cell wall biosynthesis